MKPLLFVGGALCVCGALFAQAHGQERLTRLDRAAIYFEPDGGGSRFEARGRGLTLQVSETGAELVIHKGERATEPARIGLHMLGGQKPRQLEGTGLQSGVTHYYGGVNPRQWRRNVPHYANVRASEVYPGIDVVYHGRQNQLEYDFVVKPGADPGLIRIAFPGAEPTLDPEGGLLLNTRAGVVRQRQPIIYQMAGNRRIPVDGKYRLNGAVATFELAAYDHQRELVIDPIIYSTLYGGNGADRFFSFSSSLAGTCAVGETDSFDNGDAPGGATNALVVWMPESGPAVRAVFGGNGSSTALGVAGDCGRGTVIVGRTSATNFPGAENNNSGGTDGFMLALGDSLALMNSRYVGGAGDDSLVSITAGYVAGSTDSGILEGRASLGGMDAFVGGYQLDSGGRVQFKMLDRLGGAGDDSAVVLKEYSRMAPDPEAPFLKELMLAGTTDSDHLSGASRTSFGGGTDGFYVRLRPEDSGLRVVEANYVGGSRRDSVADISVESGTGAMRMLLTTDSPELPGESRSLAGMSTGGRDAAVVRIDGEGSALYNVRIGGAGDDEARSIFDSTVAGTTRSDAGIPMVNALGSKRAGEQDIFVVSFDDSADLATMPVTFSTHFGGAGDDTVTHLGIDAANRVVMAGFTTSARAFPLTADAEGNTVSGDGEAFLVRMTPGAGDAKGSSADNQRFANTSAPRLASATFLGADNVTQGAWKTLYGGDGYYIPNLVTSYPAYAAVIRTGTPYTWDPNPGGPEAPRALDKPTPPGRFASAVIDGSTFQFDINFTDAQPHRVALYMHDWQSSTSTETVVILDQATNAVLDTQNVTAYRSGRWLVYTLSGRVIIRVTRTGGSWAQLAGIFFGGSASGSLTATAGTPQSTVVNTAFPVGLQVTLKDGSNLPIPGAVVSFSAPGSGASANLSAPTATTNASGIASVTATANAIAGSYLVTASANGSSTTFSLTNQVGPPATILATGGASQTTTVNTAFGSALQATVRDALSNAVSGVLVTFTPPVSGATSTLSAPSAITNAAGVASVTATANGTVGGPYSVTATTAGVAGSVAYSLTNAANTPASIATTGGGAQNATVSTAFTTALQVTVKNAGNSPVSGVLVTFAVPPSGASATLSSPTATTDGSGIASVTATANATAGGPYTVSATVAGVVTPANFQLTNSPVGSGSASAVFLGADTVTQGAWKTQYGGDGYYIPNVATAFPSYATVIIKGTPFTWFTPAPTEPRALDHPTAATKSATSIIDSVFDQFDINLTDGQPHRVAFYLMDWNNGYSESVQVLDQATNAVLDTQTVASYNTGRWLVYTLRGRVLVKFTRTGGSYAQVSGAFFGGAAAGTVSTTGGSPQSTTVNAAFGTALQAIVRDGSNAPIPGVLVTFAVPGSGASAVLSAPTATTNSSGVASVTATANGVAGSYQVTGTANGNSAIFSLTNLAGPAASIITSGGTPQSATVNAAFATAIQATVRDAASNAVSGVVVTFVPPGAGAGATLSSITATTNASGVASVTATANATAGPYNVGASAPGTGSVNFALTNLAGPAASVSATGGALQTTSVNNAFSTALQTTVRDAANNLVSGVTVNFAVPGSGASASLSSASAVTNASGVASVTATANAIGGGPYNVTATVAGVAGSALFALTNTVNPPASVAVSAGSPQTAAINTAFGTPLQAIVRDAGNLAVSGVTVNFAAPGSGPSATLSAPSAVSNASGIATVTATANGTVGGAYTVVATVAGVAGAANFSLTNSGSPPASVTVNAGSPQSATVLTAFGSVLRVIVRDALTNPVPGVTVNFAAPGAGASATLSVPSAITDGAGLASVSATANTIAGSYNVNATVVGVAGAAVFALTNTAGAAASISATAGTPQSAVVGSPFVAAIQATVRDANNNPVPGVQVTFTPPASGPSAVLSSLTANTNAAGQASVTATANATAGGPYNVAATVVGVAAAANFQLTNTPIGGGAATAVFLGVDDTTKGAWKTGYGGDGYHIVNVGASLPAYATLSTTGTPFTWYTPAPSEARALDNPSGIGKSATALIDAVADTLDINLTDGLPHRVAFYMVDYNVSTQTLQVFDKNTNVLLGTQTVAGYSAGRWISYTITGRVLVKFNRTAGSWAQVSGVFFGPPANGSVNAITGTPQSTLIGTTFATPLQVRVLNGSGTPISGTPVTFTAPAAGASALLSLPTVNTDASGYASITATANATGGTYLVTAAANGTSTTFSLTNNSGPPASVAVSGGGIQTATISTNFGSPLQVTVRDSGNNPISGVLVTFALPNPGASATLSSLTVTTNGAGVASVTATANATAGSYPVNATVAGVVAPAVFTLTNIVGSVTPAVVEFVRFDLTTQGWWRLDGINRGQHGYTFPTATAASPFQFGAVTPPATTVIWNANAVNAQALQKPDNFYSRVAAAFTSAVPAVAGVPAKLEIDLTVVPGRSEQVALYWMNGDGAARAQSIDILDAQTQAVLYTRAIPNFDNGRWMIWNISGHVTIRITEPTVGQLAVCSGIFFDQKP